MSIGGCRQSQLSFADLVTLYEESDVFERRVKALGFEKSKQADVSKDKDKSAKILPQPQPDLSPDQDSPKQPTVDAQDRSPLVFYYIAKRERLEKHLTPPSEEIPQWFQDAEPLVDDVIYDPNAAIPDWQPLTRKPKLWAKLRQHLIQTYTSEQPDIPRLVQQLSRGDYLSRLPFRQQKQRIRRLYVLADYADHLVSFRQDYSNLYHDLVRHWGRQRIIWRNTRDCPLYTLNKRDFTPDTGVILLTDFGALNTKTSRSWQTWMRYFKRQGILSFALAPAAIKDLQSLCFRGTEAYSWDQALPAVRITATDDPSTATKTYTDVGTLLTHLAFTYRIEPALLRAMRLRLGLSVSVEVQCRRCAHVHDDHYFLYIQEEQRHNYHQRFKQLTNTQKQQAIELVQQHHAHGHRSILDQELMNAQGLCDFTIPAYADSKQQLQRFSKTLARNPDNHLLRCWTQTYLQDSAGQESEINTALFAHLYAENDWQQQTLPKGVTLDVLAKFKTLNQPSEPYIIEQKDKHLRLVKDQPTSAKTIAQVTFSQQVIKVDSVWDDDALGSDDKAFLPHSLITLKDAVSLPKKHSIFSFDTGTEHITLLPTQRPSWAQSMARDAIGLFVECEHHGKLTKIYYPSCGGKLEHDEYGVYFDLSIKGITQRFRYIEPNTFMMGSPEDEVERYDDEDYHQVTLTQGYWLADTACTQELWIAAMGENPSDFKDNPQNPVENVSWLDVQEFIAKLNQAIPNLKAHLPTEAQWENACRAGTTTPFSFGKNITSDQVNYDATEPYADGKKGEYRKKTVPVKALPANPWGLYEMHGNVWEWCIDEWQENLGTEPVTDPANTSLKSGVKPDKTGIQSSTTLEKTPVYDSTMLVNADDSVVTRVLRGGAWILSGRLCRSAFRGGHDAADRFNRFGFRIALGYELQSSRVLRSNQDQHRGSDTAGKAGKAGKAGNSSEQTGTNPARGGAAQDLGQAGSGGDSNNVFKKAVDKWLRGKS